MLTIINYWRKSQRTRIHTLKGMSSSSILEMAQTNTILFFTKTWVARFDYCTLANIRFYQTVFRKLKFAPHIFRTWIVDVYSFQL